MISTLVRRFSRKPVIILFASLMTLVIVNIGLVLASLLLAPRWRLPAVGIGFNICGILLLLWCSYKQTQIRGMEFRLKSLLARHRQQTKQSQDDLANSERRCHELLNLAADGIMVGTHEGIITHVNECMCELFQMRREVLIGKRYDELPFTEESVRNAPFCLDLLHQGEVVVRERVVQRADGTQLAVELRSKMMPDGMLQSIYRDVTERKKIQNALEILNVTLEQRVMMRAIQSQKYASQLKALTGRLVWAEEAMRQRLAHALHDDLQQVLVAARMTLDVALKEGFAEPQAEVVRRVDKMLSEALLLTRTLTQELSVPAVQEGDLESAIRWVAQQMKSKFGLEVSIQADNVPTGIRKDIFLCLYRAVQELLFNVVKHSGCLSSEVVMRKDLGDVLRVTVNDPGVGFIVDWRKGCQAPNKGFGLFGIRQRLEGLGGRMEVLRNKGGGGMVVLLAPLSAGERQWDACDEHSAF